MSLTCGTSAHAFTISFLLVLLLAELRGRIRAQRLACRSAMDAEVTDEHRERCRLPSIGIELNKGARGKAKKTNREIDQLLKQQVQHNISIHTYCPLVSAASVQKKSCTRMRRVRLCFLRHAFLSSLRAFALFQPRCADQTHKHTPPNQHCSPFPLLYYSYSWSVHTPTDAQEKAEAQAQPWLGGIRSRLRSAHSATPPAVPHPTSSLTFLVFHSLHLCRSSFPLQP